MMLPLPMRVYYYSVVQSWLLHIQEESEYFFKEDYSILVILYACCSLRVSI